MKNNFNNKKWIGYLILLTAFILIIKTHLMSFFIILLFIYLFTEVFTNSIHKWVPKIPIRFIFFSFYILLIGIFLFISIRIVPQFINDLPEYLNLINNDLSILTGKISAEYNIHINYDYIKTQIISYGSKSINDFFHLFTKFFKVSVFFIFALVLNFLLFTEKKVIAEIFTQKHGSYLTHLYHFINEKIGLFYLFFKKVMGGQVIISLINTFITLIIVIILNLPHKITLVCLIFLCGLIPIFGNIISNTIISLTALFMQGFIACMVCLILLISIHKLEYFLNSKIIGHIVKLPMFIALLSLLLGEALLGLSGLVISIPLALFIKTELENHKSL